MGQELRSDAARELGGEVVFVKLGGSLITDKTGVEVPRWGVIKRLAKEIAEAKTARPGVMLLLGHGSGSFGHAAGQRYGTRLGVHSAADWLGFAQTAFAAQRLNRIVTAALWEAGVPVWSLQPSASAVCRDGDLVSMEDWPVKEGLAHGLVPLVYGDVVLDEKRGGTIVSTEEIFVWLARCLRPQRIVLVGDTSGVMPEGGLAPTRGRPIPEINPQTVGAFLPSLGASRGTDVTGGMLAKVLAMCDLVSELPGLEVRLINGRVRGLVARVLSGEDTRSGTAIRLA